VVSLTPHCQRGVWSLMDILALPATDKATDWCSRTGLRLTAQGCCTQLPWEGRRGVSQPQRGCGPVVWGYSTQEARRVSGCEDQQRRTESLTSRVSLNPVGVGEVPRHAVPGS
jgi:hypothetical protein